MDPTLDPNWLNLLFGPGAMNTSQLTGGDVTPSFEDRFTNNLPFATPTVGVGGQSAIQPTPSAVPTAPTGAGVPNPPPMPAPPPTLGPPAMPPAVAPVAAPPGLMNKAETDPNNILAALRGIQAPPAPVAQHITTPHPPQTHAIAPGNLAQLFASLGISPQQLPQLGRRTA